MENEKMFDKIQNLYQNSRLGSLEHLLYVTDVKIRKNFSNFVYQHIIIYYVKVYLFMRYTYKCISLTKHIWIMFHLKFEYLRYFQTSRNVSIESKLYDTFDKRSQWLNDSPKYDIFRELLQLNQNYMCRFCRKNFESYNPWYLAILQVW